MNEVVEEDLPAHGGIQEEQPQIDEEEYLQQQESSRVSTNDSNDLEGNETNHIDFNLRVTDAQEDIRIHSKPNKIRGLSNNKTQWSQQLIQILQIIWTSIKSTAICLIVSIYHLLTTLFFMTMCLFSSTMFIFYVYRVFDMNLTIWIYVGVTMTLLFFRVILKHVFPDSDDLRDFLRGSVRRLSTRHAFSPNRQRQRSQTSPQQHRTQSSSRRETDDIQMTDFRSASRNRQSPTIRLRFNPELTIDQMRRVREDRIRNEVFNQLLRRVNFLRDPRPSRGRRIAADDLNNLFMLRSNLQLLQLQALGREFNETDYDFLSSLDHYSNAETSQRVAKIVNQLPTYIYKSQQNNSPSKDQDSIGHYGEIPEFQKSNSGEKLKSTDPEICLTKDIEDKEAQTHNSCSICIEPYENEDIIKILPCFHQFHAKCADDWLLRKSVCPVCKFDIDISDEQLMLNENNQ